MQIPASQIAIADPTCPSCGGRVSTKESACSSCGFGFEVARQLLPFDAPALRKFIDFENYLSREEIKRAHRAMTKLHKRFPQVTVCSCFVTIPDGLDPAEFGFWLFNQSVPADPRLSERRMHSILLVVDPSRAEASLTVGYGIDPFLSDEALRDCLGKIRRELSAGKFGKAVDKLCVALRTTLDEAHRFGVQAVSTHIAERRQHRQIERPVRQLPPRQQPPVVEPKHARSDRHVF